MDITFLEKTQVTENCVLGRIICVCQPLFLVDIEQAIELGLRVLLPNPISFLRGFKVSRINGACSARAPRALFIICVRHVFAREDSCM